MNRNHLITVKPPISLLNFRKVGLIIGKVVECAHNPKAKIPAYCLQLDLGQSLLNEHQKLHKKNFYVSSAQLCSNHTVSELQNQFLLCVYNFPRKQIGTMMSDCLTTGVQNPSSSNDEKRLTTIFVRPSTDVPLGSKVGLCGEEEIYVSNSRSLTWSEFASLDLWIGTISDCKAEEKKSDSKNETESSQSRTLQKIRMIVDLGSLGKRAGVGFLKSTFDVKTLEGRQVLVLTNLREDDLTNFFKSGENTVVLCTIGGQAILEPAKKIDNGYKLA